MKAQLFATCLVDTFYPETGEATLRLLKRFGVSVEYPRDQTCCGKPPNSAGYEGPAKAAARHFLSTFKGSDPIIIPSGSCAAMVRVHYPEMFKDEPQLKAQLDDIISRSYELTEFLVHKLNAHEAEFKGSGSVTYHSSCQLNRELGIKHEPVTLLKSMRGVEFIELPNADRCCGFGGVFMGKLPEISMAIADEKALTIIESRADTVVGCDHGCLMNISDALRRNNGQVKVMHIARYLAEAL
jgi:L-lactate dehydrogenase complex protein LldE